jgi:hypothetical protein
LALFFRGPLQVLFITTPFPIRSYPPLGPSRNWVCLYNRLGAADRPVGVPPPVRPQSAIEALALFGAIRLSDSSTGDSPAYARPGPGPQIGFVFPKPVPWTIHHKSFPANHLPFALPWPQLGLFGAFALRSSPPS